MKRTKLLKDVRKLRFEESYKGMPEGSIDAAKSARLFGECQRNDTFLQLVGSSLRSGVTDVSVLRYKAF